MLKVWNSGNFKGNYAGLPRPHQGGHAGEPDAEPVHARDGRPPSSRRSLSRCEPPSARRGRELAPDAGSGTPGGHHGVAAKDITFVIPGQLLAAVAGGAGTRGSVKASVRVGAQRGGGDPVRVVATPGEDVVVLSIVNGPTLVLHPQDARDLMRAQAGPGTRSGRGRCRCRGRAVAARLAGAGIAARGARCHARLAGAGGAQRVRRDHRAVSDRRWA